MTGCCSAAPASIPVAGGGSSGQGDTEQRTINGQGWSQWLRIFYDKSKRHVLYISKAFMKS